MPWFGRRPTGISSPILGANNRVRAPLCQPIQQRTDRLVAAQCGGTVGFGSAAAIGSPGQPAVPAGVLGREVGPEPAAGAVNVVCRACAADGHNRAVRGGGAEQHHAGVVPDPVRRQFSGLGARGLTDAVRKPFPEDLSEEVPTIPLRGKGRKCQ